MFFDQFPCFPQPSLPPTAPTPDSCIDIVHLTHQLQHARGMGASIIIGAFAAGLPSTVRLFLLNAILIHTAASNVTGALADVHAVTAVLHSHSALAGAHYRRPSPVVLSHPLFLLFSFPVWDYATAAPYVQMLVPALSRHTFQTKHRASHPFLFSCPSNQTRTRATGENLILPTH